jgi:16S rRNA C1402 (ribose-2'-O) methylase RsmI
VVPLIGPSSLLLALMASGLNGQKFAFQGYLPTKEVDRTKALRDLESESRKRQQTQLFIETPYRNRTMFDAILIACQPATRMTVATDLTLATESVITRTIQAWKNKRHPISSGVRQSFTPCLGISSNEPLGRFLKTLPETSKRAGTQAFGKALGDVVLD